MADKVENALNETRILVLIVQVLLGFQLQSFFTKAFDRLPHAGQLALLIGLALQLLALALLLLPPAYHRIVDRELLSNKLCALTTDVVGVALWLLAAALGIQFAVIATPILGRTAAIAGGSGLSVLAILFWWGLEVGERRLRRPARYAGGCATDKGNKEDMDKKEDGPLGEKIKFALTETRVVLPGAQALLGFQFMCVLSEPFAALPHSLQQLHLLSLAGVAVSAIFLMAPAAYHRIVEKGESTHQVLQFTGHMLLAAMFFLALGIAGDIYVVVEKVLKSSTWAASSATLTLAACYGLWFGYTFFARYRSSTPIGAAAGAHPQ